jgi:hypothetical protein
MRYGFLIFSLVFILDCASVSAFEVKKPERKDGDLRIELSPSRSQVQKDFDRYAQELAAAAQKEATPEERARKDGATKDGQPKVYNPIALLRW